MISAAARQAGHDAVAAAAHHSPPPPPSLPFHHHPPLQVPQVQVSCEGAVLRELLGYLYTGELAGAVCADIGLLVGVLCAANQYMLDGLQLMCEMHFADVAELRRHRAHVWDLLVAADSIGAARLHALCTCFVLDCFEGTRTPAHLPAHLPALLPPPLLLELTAVPAAAACHPQKSSTRSTGPRAATPPSASFTRRRSSGISSW